MNSELVEYLEFSFLKEILKEENVTDISYNGESFFYMDSYLGRRKLDIEVSQKEVMDFIRQVANLAEKQFSYSEPILDITAGRYRINAVHSSIVRVGDDKSISFCIRIASLKNRIDDDEEFMSQEMEKYLQSILSLHESLIIVGPTGTGKTELQKYLIIKIGNSEHIIVIDNIQELESLRANKNLDLTTWQISSKKSFQDLIKTALRNNPDWLVIAEARGEEMADALLSALSGHPIITTLHAKEEKDVIPRIIRMIQSGNKSQDYNDIKNDVYVAFQNYVFVKREIDKDGRVKRFVDKICRLNKTNGKLEIIFRRNINEKI